MVVSNLVAQQVPFNAIFLVSDPMQKWRLLANFVLYFLPFLAGALFLGTVFLKAQKTFNRVYFADLVGSGLCGLSRAARDVCLPARRPHHGAAAAVAGRRRAVVRARSATGAASRPSSASRCWRRRCTTWRPARSASPSSRCRTTRASPTPANSPTPSASTSARSPFGYLEIYSSSYLHFAPGLSDNAAFNLPEHAGQRLSRPVHRSEGPSGIIKDLPADETAYFSTCRCTTPTS